MTEKMVKSWITEASIGNPARFIQASQKETIKVISKVDSQ